MATFGRFELGKDEPTETYEGGCMVLKDGYVKILRDKPNSFGWETEEVVVLIRLDKGQTVRKITRMDRRPLDRSVS